MDRALTPRPRARRRRAGAVMLEAVIVLFALAAVLLGVLYLPSLHGTRSAAAALARRCALQHAANGCDADAIPQACTGVVGRGGAPDGDSAVSGSASRLPRRIPVLDAALGELLGTTAEATAERGARGPLLPGARERRVKRRFVVLCNNRPTSPGKLAADLFHDWVPDGDDHDD